MKRGMILALLLVIFSSVAYAGTLIAAETPSQLFFGVGKHYFSNADFEKAAYYFEKSIEENENFAEGYHNLAVSQYKLGNFESSIDNFENAIGINPGYSSAYYNLGLLEFEMKDYSSAILNFEKAVDLEGTSQQHFDLAQAYVAIFRQKEDSGNLALQDLDLLRSAEYHLLLAQSVEHSASNLEIVRQVLSGYESQ